MTHDPPRSDRMDTAQERRHALTILLATFAEAELDGLGEDCLTQAALFIAFQKLVNTYGEEPVAVFAERLPERIRQGEFSTITRQ